MRPTVPIVKITLDKERTLRFDFNALSAFEERTGKSALEASVWAKPDARTLHALLWAALLHEDPDLTMKDVGAIIHMGNLKYVSEKIREASIAANPEAEDADEGGSDGKNPELLTG